jgi:hypothetical protein
MKTIPSSRRYHCMAIAVIKDVRNLGRREIYEKESGF